MSETLETRSTMAPLEGTEARVRAVLRVHTEPCTYLDDWDVHDALTIDPAGYVEHLADRLAKLACQSLSLELPPKTIFGDDAGDFRVMPCVTGSGATATKTVKVVGTNLIQERVPDQITVGKAVRLDPLENFVTHVYDACLLSSARTGACAALAARQLAPRADCVGIVGAGRVGYYAARYLAASASVKTVKVCDVNALHASSLAAALEDVGADCRVGTLDEVLACDILVIATTARAALVSPSDTAAELVVSLGADSEDQHELADDWCSNAVLYMDSTDALEVGDLRAWSNAGLLSRRPATLLDLFAEPRLPPHERRVFVSAGSALLDNLTIDYLLLESPRQAAYENRA